MILEKIKEIIAEWHGWPEDQLTMDARFEQFNATDVEIGEILIGCEDYYEIMFPADFELEVRTIGEVVEYIEKHIN